jgi:probable phosphoglycerate mutase
MELLIIRHALPERIVNPDTPADPPLAPDGRRQAELLAGYLASERIDAIWSSPMVRAQETAQPLAKAFGLDVQTEDAIAEWDRESTVYIPIEELKASNDPMWQAMVRGEWTGAGDPVAFHRDVVAGFERIIAAHPGQRVAAICHGGVINSYVSHILGITGSVGFFQPDYTSIHRVMAASSGERSLRALNETAHLRGTGLLR